MQEGSYAEIRHGMKVIGRDGHTLGGIDEVIVDEGSGIFIGLSVRPNLFTHSLFIPGDRLERVRDGEVYVTSVQEELDAYHSPEERYHEAEKGFDTSVPYVP
jgi:sporulation protein YlmC with PRC-barrel domain